MSLSSFFGFGASQIDGEIPDIFPLGIKKETFVEIDVINIFQKILTDVAERIHGLEEGQCDLLWDNCIQSEASHGLISQLARAMAFKRNLFLVYDRALNVIRLATPAEQEIIRADYAKQGVSKVGLFVSFQHFLKADLVLLYSALEYCTIGALNKSMNLSNAIQIKINDLRGSVSLNDASVAKAQAIEIAKALGKGRDIMLDAKDIIDLSKPDLTSIHEAIKYLNEKRSFYLGLPPSYLHGDMTTGIGTTGESDTKATERGLKNYYASIMKPVLEALFDVDLSYKSQDFRQVDQAVNALKIFALTDESIISLENKTLIINKLLDLPEDEEGTGIKEGALPPDEVAENNAYPQI